MSDFLTRLAERTLGLTSPVQPLNAPRYAPAVDLANPGESPTELEIPQRTIDTGRPPSSSRHSSPETAAPAQDPVHTRRRLPEEKRRNSQVAEEEAARSSEPVSSDRRADGDPSPEVETSPPDVEVRESSRPPTTGRRVPGIPDLVPPNSSPSAPNPEVASSDRRSELEHEAVSTPDARPEIAAYVPRYDDANVLARHQPGEPTAGTQRSTRDARVPDGEDHGAKLSGSRVEGGFHDEGVPERPEESPFTPLAERSKTEEEDDAPSPPVREDTVGSSPSEPSVRITIGRIDVRAVSPPPTPQRKNVRPAPGPTLDAYLRSHNGQAP
jgi:hypothetical protein